MKLFHNSIVYTPEQEGNGAPHLELESLRKEIVVTGEQDDDGAKKIESAEVQDLDKIDLSPYIRSKRGRS
jgi:hypothetical protein